MNAFIQGLPGVAHKLHHNHYQQPALASPECRRHHYRVHPGFCDLPLFSRLHCPSAGLTRRTSPIIITNKAG